MNVVDKLCTACRKLFSDQRVKLKARGFNERYEHHNPWHLLETAAQKGCYVCSRVWGQLSPAEQHLVRSTHRWSRWLAKQKWLPDYGLPSGIYGWVLQDWGIEFIFGPGYGGWRKVSFDLISAKGSINFDWGTAGRLMPPYKRRSIRKYINGIDLATSTDSDKTWNTITNWWQASMQRDALRRKNKAHTKTDLTNCPVPAAGLLIDASRFPTRLLDLKHTSVHDDLSLSIADMDVRDGPYMTLSYRWRTVKEPLQDHRQLSHESLDAMRSRIPFAALPRVYQDAIVVTRRLGVRYLWIDAMCILQNDVHDWNIESSRMGQIYRSAICNIAAGVGDMDDGLFARRVPEDIMPLKVEVNWYDVLAQRRKSSMADCLTGSHYLIEHGYFEHHISQASLNKRGWVVQERFLSSRVLHFSPTQVFWQEDDLDACELFPIGCLRPKKEISYPRDRDSKPRVAERASEPVDPRAWNEVIHYYSTTLLTRPEDKMSALAGLAQQWSSLLPEDEYCAGLWKSTFPQCLLWKVTNGRNGDHGRSYRSLESQVPSWSWLSVHGGVKSFAISKIYGPRETAAKMLAFKLQPRSPDFKLGPLKNGSHLVVRGRIQSAEGMYWPMSILYKNSADSDWSTIEARRTPLRHPVSCSIDDMTAFLKRWNNTVPSQERMFARICWIVYQLAPYIAFIGFIFPLILGRVRLGLMLILTGLSLRKFMWHFNNIGSPGIYFLEIYKPFEDHSQGLVLQRLADGTYSRLGVFRDNHNKVLFNGVVETEVTLV